MLFQIRARVKLYGGPLDGFQGMATIYDEPGARPVVTYRKFGRQYVYRGRLLLEDSGLELEFDFESSMPRED